MTIKSLGLVISILLGLLTIILLTGSIVSIGKVDAIGDTWANFERDAAKKDVYLRELYDAIGYGGLIHEFKNYILRQDQPRIAKARARAAEAIAALDGYTAHTSDPLEREALEVIRATVVEYLSALSVAESLAAEGTTPRQLDGTVIIDDRAALGAMQSVFEIKVERRLPHWLQFLIHKYRLRSESVSKFCNAALAMPLSLDAHV